VHAFSQLRFDLLKRGPHAVAPTFALELEGSASGLAADEDEPQEGERLWLAEPARLSTRRRQAAERQQSRLVPVQLQRELLKPLAHRIPEPPRIRFALEARHDVIGIAHDDHLAGGLAPAPLVGPEVEDVVQEDIGQQL
jgi:hypothetical protein